MNKLLAYTIIRMRVHQEYRSKLESNVISQKEFDENFRGKIQLRGSSAHVQIQTEFSQWCKCLETDALENVTTHMQTLSLDQNTGPT